MSRRALLGLLSLLSAAAAGCGPGWMQRAPDTDRPPSEVSKPGEPGEPAAHPAAAARAKFQNPGGMWTPQQLGEHQDRLRELGLELDPAALTDPLAYPLGAVIYLGGCTASFVSPDGLVITNHHCATGALQHSSTPERNLLRDGFVAQNRQAELYNGPTARIYVTQSYRDVTGKVRRGLEALTDPLQRYKTVEQRSKDLVAGCERGRPELRCEVASYYDGAQYLLIERLEIPDVRLVYAPPESVGAFGGEIDNWRWPRHSGDFALYRAYVGPDGQPADHSPANVPYHPKQHLKLASQPLAEGDLVLVTGFPARTTRLRTAREVEQAVDWYYPHLLRQAEDFIALLERLSQGNEQLTIKAKRLVRGLSNRRTYLKGMLDGLVKGGAKDRKIAQEKELRTWLSSQPGKLAEAGAALDSLAQNHAAYSQHRQRDAATTEAVWASTLLGAADTIVHLAAERPKPDAERHPSFQQRNHKRLIEQQKLEQGRYDRTLDQAKLKLSLQRSAALPADQQPELLALIVGKKQPTEAVIDQALGALYAKTELESVERRIELLQTATTAELSQSKDPFIALAVKLRPILQAIEDRADTYAGTTIIDRPVYIAALRKKVGQLAPDANATLRITYGTVRGYRPRPDAPEHVPFTKLSEMVAKNTGKEPFNAPQRLLDAARSGPFGPYVHQKLGEVPIDFLTDLDITGGNSGSPTLNARGELVGLAFDGNYEAMASDWLFMPDITRAIHVDLRYLLWLLDKVEGAAELLEEMGVKPALQ